MESNKKIIRDNKDLEVHFKQYDIENCWAVVEDITIEFDFIITEITSRLEEHLSQNPSFDEEKYGIRFINCHFNINLYLSKTSGTDRDIYFEDCIFNNIITLSSSKGIITFDICKFNKIFKAKDAKLEGKIKFWVCDFFEDANFRNTKFFELADFWRSTFHKKTIFYKTDFLNTVVFSAVTFKENVLFTYTLINKLILFRGTKIKKGFDLSLAIIYGKLGLFGFDLIDYKDYQFINNEDEYEKAVSENGIIPIKNKRETFRILKDNLESQKNLSESLIFKAVEKEVLRLELINSNLNYTNVSFISNLKFKVNNRLERLNLRLNKYSNDYGDSYGRALLFVLFFGWLIFYLSLLSTETYSFSLNYDNWIINDNVKYFIEFLNPLHKNDYLGKQIILSPSFYIIDFVGKIIVGYGIYQFIQAFRKYK
jgi:hypothetical protein